MVLGFTTLAVAVLFFVFSLGMVFGRAFVTVDAGDLPAGHPYVRLDGGDASFSCTTLVGYVAGDRDPLCQNDVRLQSAIVVVAFIIAVGLAALSRRIWRRWHQSSPTFAPGGDRSGRVRVLLISYRTSIVAFGAVVVIVGAAAVFLGPNGGAWENTKVVPPTVPGLRDWSARTGPLITALATEAAPIPSAIGQNDPTALGPACDQFFRTATELSAAAVPAPDPGLDMATRQAVAATSEAAQACQDAAHSREIGFGAIQLTSKLGVASEDWQHVADAYIRLKVGPGS
jgi:hypothetical protein